PAALRPPPWGSPPTPPPRGGGGGGGPAGGGGGGGGDSASRTAGKPPHPTAFALLRRSTSPRERGEVMVAFPLRASSDRHLENDALPMVRVRHRDGERIGGVIRGRFGLRQQHADHHADLRLVAVAGADDALLHQVRCVFGDRHAGARRYHHGNAARLAELERRVGILVHKGR